MKQYVKSHYCLGFFCCNPPPILVQPWYMERGRKRMQEFQTKGENKTIPQEESVNAG
jgi:hypothetical protein